MSSECAAFERARAARAAAAFAIEGELVALEPLVRGHINETWVSTWEQAGARRRYLHQRINEAVFPDARKLMHNIELVTRHVERHVQQAGGDSEYESLRLVETRDGGSWVRGDFGPWRTYDFVEGTESRDRCAGPDQAHAVARIFGWFQARLADLDASDLFETIPSFFSPGHRWRQFEAALASPADPARVEAAAAEIAYVHGQRPLLDLFEGHLAAGRIPSRIVHGDTKLNNVLIDLATGRPRTVVDLDTCMPGFLLYDFGDMVRFTAATSAEDEQDLSQAGTDLELYTALKEGYLDCAGDALTSTERQLVPLAGPLVTLVIGLRFLTDHLAGDVYFGVHREGHNLDRARVQLAQVACMEAMRDRM